MYIYKFLGECNEVLYIGKTSNLLKRMKQHFRSECKEWKKKSRKFIMPSVLTEPKWISKKFT